MKIIITSLFVVTALFCEVALAHGDVHLEFPLHITCEQIDNKTNGWTAHHLFSFQKNGNEVVDTIRGQYKSYQANAVAPGQEAFAGVAAGVKEIRENQTQGQVSVPLSMIEGHFPTNAIGFESKKDISGIPAVVLGAEIFVNEGQLTEMHALVKSGNNLLLPKSYNAKCSMITAAEAKKF